MSWILVDVVLVLLAMAVLAVLALGLWRKVKALSRAVSQAGEQVTRATDALAVAQGAGPMGALPTRTGPARAADTARSPAAQH